jgi:hypothetical protein
MVMVVRSFVFPMRVAEWDRLFLGQAGPMYLPVVVVER